MSDAQARICVGGRPGPRSLLVEARAREQKWLRDCQLAKQFRMRVGMFQGSMMDY